MEPQEVDSALDELENRLDRLRSLYEQYFMGIEKIEPTVPRKDVDRRFWILRRTQIRNTARRFRMQTLVQRYNTFQQHWTRICREIENGTYVRHLLKAQKNLGAEPKTWAAKKRLGYFRRDRVGPDGAPVEGAPGAENSPPQSNGGTDSRRPSIPPSIAPSRAEPAMQPAAAQPAPAGRTTESVAALGLQQAELRPLDLDLDDDAPTLPPPGRAAKPALPAVRTQAAPAATAGNPKTAIAPPLPKRPVGAPARPVPPAAPLQNAPGNLPKPVTAQSSRPVIPRPQSAIPNAGAGPKPATAPQATAPIAAPRPPTAPQAAPVAAPRPAAVAASPPKPAAAPPTSGLSDERVRQLHAELSAARKQLNQNASLSVDSLAKTLRDTETKLRAQHGGKSVDFQVVIKDGKPIVKPVVRR